MKPTHTSYSGPLCFISVKFVVNRQIIEAAIMLIIYLSPSVKITRAMVEEQIRATLREYGVNGLSGEGFFNEDRWGAGVGTLALMAGCEGRKLYPEFYTTSNK